MANNNYYIYNGDVYKWLVNSEHFLQMTGWDKSKNKDRRKLKCEIDETKLSRIKDSKALEMINTYWNNGVRTWVHNGHTYDNSCADICRCPDHCFEHVWYGRNEQKFTNVNSYKLVWHQGKIYWANWFHYYPRVLLYHFIDLETEPTSSVFAKWTKAFNCRGIVDKDSELLI